MLVLNFAGFPAGENTGKVQTFVFHFAGVPRDPTARTVQTIVNNFWIVQGFQRMHNGTRSIRHVHCAGFPTDENTREAQTLTSEFACFPRNETVRMSRPSNVQPAVFLKAREATIAKRRLQINDCSTPVATRPQTNILGSLHV